jgi:hypothetical protein
MRSGFRGSEERKNEGPLGLSGQAISIVKTYDLVPAEKGGTLLTVSVHGSGEMDEKVPAVVERAWKHFIVERFKPYVESGTHRKKAGRVLN